MINKAASEMTCSVCQKSWTLTVLSETEESELLKLQMEKARDGYAGPPTGGGETGVFCPGLQPERGPQEAP